MKKIFTQLLMLCAAVVTGTMSSRAATVTLTVDNPEAVNVSRTGNAGYKDCPWGDNGTMTLELTPDEGLQVSPNRECIIDNILLNEAPLEAGKWGAQYGTYFASGTLKDGDKIDIKAHVKKPPTVIIKGDPERIYMTSNAGDSRHDETNCVNGQWEFTVQSYETIVFYAKEGYYLASIVDDENNEQIMEAYKYDTRWTISASAMSKEVNTFTVKAVTEEEFRPYKFTLQIIGDPSGVYLQRQGKITNLIRDNVSEYTFNFAPGVEPPFYVSSTDLSKDFYKVEIGGKAVEKDASGAYPLNVADGDKVTVHQSFPDVDIPFTINLVQPDTEDAVRLQIDNQDVPAATWMASGYTVKMGQSYTLSVNDYEFNVNSFTLNGEDISHTALGAATDTNGYVFTVDVTRKPPYKVNIIADPNAVTVCNTAYPDKPYELTGPETMIEVPFADHILSIEVKEYYHLENIKYNGENADGTMIVLDKENSTLEIVTKAYARDNDVVIYLDEQTAWTSTGITLAPDQPKHKTDVTLQKGYNIVKYDSFDMPFQVKLSPAPMAYINDFYTADMNGFYLLLSYIEPNSVIKFFGSEPDEFNVTFDIADGLGVQTLLDYVTPANEDCKVLNGTEIAITPTEAKTYLTVTANGQNVAPDAQGRHIVKVTADTAVKVEKGESGIHSVVGDPQPDTADVYNLTGVCIKRNATRAEIEGLAPGIYIVGSKKLIK